ncbi:MAG: ABC transporter substrate-binding protein [Caldilineaceae bacterium]
MHRKVALLLILMIALLSACAAPATPAQDTAPAAEDVAAEDVAAEAQTPADTIVAAVPNEPSTWDYDFVQGDIVGLSLVKNVDPFLLDHPIVDSGNGYLTLDTTQLVGVYADSYTVSDDGLTWTITMKDGLTFPNGDPADAEAYRASRNAALTSRPMSALSSAPSASPPPIT